MKSTQRSSIGVSKRRSHWLLCLVAGLSLVSSCAATSDFVEKVTEWSEDHEQTFERASELAFNGETSAGNSLLLALVEPDDNGIAAFVVGNMLYKCDREASYRLHKLAYEKFPDEPLTNLEFAMQRHRRGEHEAAIPLYEKAFQAAIGAQKSALLADCHLRAGNLSKAVEAWNAARHPNNHTAIDFAIYEIYGELLPTQRRGDLIEKIKQGEVERIAELIELDLHFDSNWWNSQVFEPGLDKDLALSAEILGADNKLHRQLAAYADIARNEDMAAAEATRRLSNAGLMSDGRVVLPENTRFARGLCEMLLGRELSKPADLVSMLGDDLHRRIDAEDRDALHLLCMLKVRAGEKIADLDHRGWKEWNDSAFAVSHVVGLAATREITDANHPELMAALEVLPESNYLRMLRLRLAGESGTTTDMIVDAIKAEFRHLSVGHGMQDSYTLKALFYLLEKRLKEPQA